MPRQPTTLIDQIRDLCNRAAKYERETGGGEPALWQILTSLRGPDNRNGRLKATSTARVRAFVTPAAAHWAQIGTRELPECHGAGTDHFRGHIAEAAQALKQLGYIK